MATDWAADVKKYDAKADNATIAGIVRYCGIALRNRDSALVSFSDKAETDRVRTNFLKKKLALTQADSVLDAAIAKVGEAMKADRTKNRVTVYYLLASEFKQLGLFTKAAPAAKKVSAAKAAPTKAASVKAAVKPAAGKTTAAKPAAPKPATAAKAAGVAAVVAGAAAAKAKPAKATPAKKAPAAKAAAAPAKKAVAAPAKVAASAKAAAPAKTTAVPAKKAAAPAKATTTKAAAPAANATQGLLDKAATSASDAAKAAPKAAVAAAAGTVAAIGAAAAGAAHIAKDSATKAGDTASAATGAVADKASAMMSGGTKPAATTAAAAAADDGSEMNWLWWAIGIGVIALVAWFVFGRGPDDETNGTEAAASAAASEVGTDLAAAAPEGSVSIPAGAGVTSEMRDGKPVVKVYFDSDMTSVTPDFANTAGGLKSWLDTHSGAVLEVSGYSDPSGNAAANAELSKQRAQAVQSALMAVDIPATSAKLVKPAEVSDATVAKEAARRVEVVVK